MHMVAQAPAVVFGEYLQVPKPELGLYEVLDLLSLIEECNLSDNGSAYLKAERCFGALAHHFLWQKSSYGGTRNLFVEVLSRLCLEALASRPQLRGQRRVFVVESLRYFRMLYESSPPHDAARTWVVGRPVRAFLRAMHPRFGISEDVEADLLYFVEKLTQRDQYVYEAFSDNFDELCDALVEASKWSQPVLLAAVKAVVRMDSSEQFPARINSLVRTVQRLADRDAKGEADLIACLKHWVAAKLAAADDQLTVVTSCSNHNTGQPQHCTDANLL